MEVSEIRNRVERIGEDERPEEPKFSVGYMDASLDPTTDFYRYCSGKWLSSHPVPDDQVRWGAFSELIERNRYVLGKILEECAFSGSPEDPIKTQVGSFYLSAMDTQTIEELGFKPIGQLTELVENIGDSKEIIPVISKLHINGIQVAFSSWSDSDEKNSSTYAFYLGQGGLSLPNRDYYTLDSFESTRKDYRAHLVNMFVLYGQTKEEAESSADAVFGVELVMAKASRTPVELRDPERNYNKVEYDLLERRLPKLDLKLYLTDASLPPVEHIVIGQPEFFAKLGNLLEEVPLSSWKTYLIWTILHSTASYLHEAVVNEDFDFFQKKLFGRKKQEKRWKRIVGVIDDEIGEALGKLYVDKAFGPESKRKMEVMVNDLKEVFTEKLSELTWMSEQTRKRALEKFGKFRAKIGYPAKFIDYSSITVSPNDFLGNVFRSEAFEFERQIKRVGSPVDRELWEMTPPTVNAYFSPTKNEIVFPAGILQPPFFDPSLDEAVNYGATGGVISHEITHGFDDQGRKYDLDGNLKDWWSDDDAAEFNNRAKSVVRLYSSREMLPGLHVNGELTLGENIADLGGISIAYEALQRRLQREPSLRKNIDGLTPEQRFYISWSQIWRGNIREEALKWQISDNPHSPDSLRGEIPPTVHYAFGGHFSGSKTTGNGTQNSLSIW